MRTIQGRRRKVAQIAALVEGERAKITAGDHYDGSSVGVFIPVAPNISDQFPSLGEQDDSKPHVTVLHIGEITPTAKPHFLKAIRAVAKRHAPLTARLDGEVSYFDPTENSDGKRVAKLNVISEGLEALHKDIWASLEAAGIVVDHSFPEYKPHVTLGYIDPDKAYAGKVPSGQWPANWIEVWGWNDLLRIPLTGSKQLAEAAKGGKRLRKKKAKQAEEKKKDSQELKPDEYQKKHGKCPSGYNFIDDKCQPIEPSKEAPKEETKPAPQETKPEPEKAPEKKPAPDTEQPPAKKEEKPKPLKPKKPSLDDDDDDDDDDDLYDFGMPTQQKKDIPRPTEEELRTGELGFEAGIDPETGKDTRVPTKRQKALDNLAQLDWKAYQGEAQRLRDSGELPDIETAKKLAKIKNFKDLPDDVKKDKKKLDEIIQKQELEAVHERRVLHKQMEYLENFDRLKRLAGERGEKPPVLNVTKMMRDIEVQDESTKEKAAVWVENNQDEFVETVVKRSGVDPGSRRYSILKWFENLVGPTKPLRFPKFSGGAMQVTALNNEEAAKLVQTALDKGLILKLKAPNGEEMTAGPYKVAVGPHKFAGFRYGKSQWAGDYYGSSAEVAWWVVENAGRGGAAQAARKALATKASLDVTKYVGPGVYISVRSVLDTVADQLDQRGAAALAELVDSEADGLPEAGLLPEAPKMAEFEDGVIPTTNIKALPFPPYNAG